MPRSRTELTGVYNVVGTDTEQYGGKLVHAWTRRTSHHFSLCGVELQVVASHPRRYVIDTGRNGIARWLCG